MTTQYHVVYFMELWALWAKTFLFLIIHNALHMVLTVKMSVNLKRIVWWAYLDKPAFSQHARHFSHSKLGRIFTPPSPTVLKNLIYLIFYTPAVLSIANLKLLPSSDSPASASQDVGSIAPDFVPSLTFYDSCFDVYLPSCSSFSLCSNLYCFSYFSN